MPLCPERIPVIVLFGPTASGKTSLAERLFASDAPSILKNCAEIINADSMQVYKGMDIGTAKPSASLRDRLPHHLVDIFLPSEQFTAAEFVRRADTLCDLIISRKKIPVILGGTAFYIKNFLYGLPQTPQADPNTREKLKNQLMTSGAQAMHRWLAQIDPKSAQRIHVHDEYRILRALEVYTASGKPLSDFSLSAKPRAQYRFCIIGLDLRREELMQRIDFRVGQMFNQGLSAEFRSLLMQGYCESDPGMQAIGYREFFIAAKKLCFRVSALPDESVIPLVQNNSRKYAKRQLTFFKTLPEVHWFNPSNTEVIEQLCSNFIKDSQ